MPKPLKKAPDHFVGPEARHPKPELVRVPIAEEIWTTLDGRKLAVADMSEDHVRNALRHVIHTSRYAWLFKQMRVMESFSDTEIDDYELLLLMVEEPWRLPPVDFR